MYSIRPWPEAISHRGLHSEAPENSIPAFAAAIAAGADGIELDVQVSADDILIVHHDAAFRAGEEVLPFRSLDSAQIATLTLAGGVAIPTLDDAFEAIGAGAFVYIEVKVPGAEAAVVRCIRRHFANAANYSVHSFDHRIARRILELIPSVRTGLLQVSYLIDSCAAMRTAGASDLWQHADFIDASLVTDVHACGGRVIAWTSNVESEWERLAGLGVDAICTDRVDSYVAWRRTAEGQLPSGR